MTEAKRDDNYVAVGLGEATDDSQTLPLSVDPVTDELLIDLIIDNRAVATSLTWDLRDDNNKPTMYGISRFDPTVLVPIRTDENGRLLVTMN